MNFFTTTKIISRAVLLFLAFFCSLQVSHANDPQRVLMIISYHPAFPTFFDQISGVKAGFEGENIEMDIEFMDSKRFHDETNFNHFYQLLSYKLNQQPPYNAIIVADDNALSFAIEHKEDLFLNTPIVFFGVNNIDLALEQNNTPNITGVVEAVSMKETIQLMTQLTPGVTHIYAIADETPSGQGDLNTFREITLGYTDINASELSLVNLSFSELTSKLKKLNKNSAVLLLSAYRDKDGNALDFDESLQLIRGSMNVPLYHLWYHGMGDGLLGGKIISHYEQGEIAAKSVLQILNGSPVEKLPVLAESPNRYIFDFNEMAKFNITKSDLPPDSLVLNETKSFYAQFKVVIWTTTTIISVLTILVVSLSINIAKRHQTEQKLRAGEEKYRTYINSSPLGVFVADKTGRYIEVNKAAAQITDYSQQQLLNMTIPDIIAPMSQEAARTHFEHVTTTGYAEGELQFRKPDGTNYFMQVNAIKISNNSFLAYCRDITQRKQAEVILKEYSERLEAMVKERTIALEEAQKELIRKERLAMLGQLAGSVGHELRNPLGVLNNAAYFLKMTLTNADTTTKEYLNIVTLEVNRSEKIISDLLNFSRQRVTEQENVTVSTLVNQVLAKHQPPEQIKVSTQLPPDLPNVFVDPQQIAQVLINLVTNAYQAMPTGGTLSINAKSAEEKVILAIKDTGSGITPKNIKKLFEPLFTTKARGIGLGLAVSKNLAEANGGSIIVTSKNGNGATFTLTIPVAEQNA